MDRRGFLGRLIRGMAGAAVAAEAASEIDIERLLWVPKPMITVPAMPMPVHVFSSTELPPRRQTCKNTSSGSTRTSSRRSIGTRRPPYWHPSTTPVRSR